jgi:hypothetical protein
MSVRGPADIFRWGACGLFQPARRLHPLNRIAIIIKIKLPDLGTDKMTGNSGQEVRERSTGDQRNPVNCAMVIPDKTEMLNQNTQAFPAWKRSGFDDQAIKLTIGFDNGIDLFSDGLEITTRQGTVRFNQTVSIDRFAKTLRCTWQTNPVRQTRIMAP